MSDGRSVSPKGRADVRRRASRPSWRQRRDGRSHPRDARAAEAPATFFVQGRWAQAEPATARRIADDGHLIGNHSHYHARMTLLSDDGIRTDVEEADAAVSEATGVPTPPWFRCPFGDGHDDPRILGLLRRSRLPERPLGRGARGLGAVANRRRHRGERDRRRRAPRGRSGGPAPHVAGTDGGCTSDDPRRSPSGGMRLVRLDALPEDGLP